ncbi:restriction endonuclease [Pelagimonas varians]|uniref:Uncharacterized protein n=1 Tax=Pelagimonas varians TaxID=696760 RepID=A0A238L6V0_9RHOB|nr:restriction endonuclease [Pelagimonas varians]PYG26290.1 restriction endonuclease [Pelagimonas varians]SMX50102.1 hypothetical protein PEV8663_04486 [Pelagimonas varians]
MSNLIHFDVPPPKSWEHFEELCADIFQFEWSDKSLVRHGRLGQSQNGVDIYGRHGAVWPIGVQCKRKSTWPVVTVSTKELDEEVEKAKSFEPKLKEFILVSTAQSDATLQKHARSISEENQKLGLFEVHVLSWSDLVRKLKFHESVASKHYGQFAKTPISPLLGTWTTKCGKLQVDDRELLVAIRELAHDLEDFPEGRLVIQQYETEALLTEIQRFQAIIPADLETREKISDLRDDLRKQRRAEKRVLTAINILLTHQSFSELMIKVWDGAAIIRAVLELLLTDKPKLNQTSNLRLHPPRAVSGEWVTSGIDQSDVKVIFERQSDLRDRYPKLNVNSLIEMSDVAKFRYGIPTMIKGILEQIDSGADLPDLEDRKWLDTEAWTFSFS